jgi:hypothetical protein
VLELPIPLFFIWRSENVKYEKFFPPDAIELIKKLGVEDKADALAEAVELGTEKASKCELDFLWDLLEFGWARGEIWQISLQAVREGKITDAERLALDNHICSLDAAMRRAIARSLKTCGCRLKGPLHP